MAEYKGLNIVFRGDTTDASKALHLLSTEAKAAQGNLTAVQGALRNTETNGSALSETLKRMQLDELSNKLKVAQDRVSAYSQSLPQLTARLEDTRAKLDAKRAALEAMGSKWTAAANLSSQFADALNEGAKAVVQYQQELDGCEEGTEEYEQAQKNLDDAVLMHVNNLNTARDAYTKLFAQYGTVEGAINALEERERSLSEAVSSTKTNIEMQRSAAQALEAQVGTLSTALDAYTTRMYEIGETSQKVGSGLTTIGDSITSIGDKLTLVSAAVVATFGRSMLSATEEFGNSMSQLGGYLDISGSQLESMSDQALSWGKDTQFSATEAAQAMNELAKGGMTQAQISGGAMAATIELAAAGELDMASAAEVAVQAIKTFGMSAEDSSAIADALAGAANKSTAEVSDLASGFKYAGAQASLAGWDINEVSGALALMADHGLRGEMAGTALANVMKRLATPTDTAAEVMNHYGIQVRNADGTMKGAVEVVQELQDKLGGLNDEAKANALNDIFQTRGLVGAVALLDEGAEGFQRYIDATTEAGYASEMAENRMGELGWALEYLRGEAETATVNFGNALAPTIIAVANAIEGALGWFNSLSDAQRENIAMFATMAVAVGPVLSVVGHLTSGIGGLVSAFGTGAKTMSTFAQLMGDGGSAVSAFAQALAMTTTPMAETAEGMQKVAEKAAALESGIAAFGTGVGIAVVVAVLADMASTVMGVVDNMQLVNEATEGVAQATEMASSWMDGYRGAVEEATNASATLADVLATANEGLSAAAEYAEQATETYESLGSGAAMVDQYAEQIKTLAEQSELTAGEQELLKNAVEQYNEATGAAIEITDAVSGTLNLLPNQIDNVTEAYRRQAEQKAYLDLYNDAVKAQIENQQKLRQAYGQLGDASQDATNKMKPGFDLLSTIGNLHTAADVAKISQSINGLQASGEELADNVAYLEDKLESFGDSTFVFSTLEEALAAAGVTGAQWSRLTQSQLAEIEAAFDGTIASIAGKLSQFGVAMGGVGKAAVDGAADATSGVGDTVASAVDNVTDEAVKAQKRANDAAYREQQRAFDHEYKALQKQLDAVYKAQQKAYDAEYKALQKQLDAEYKQWQKYYDDIYDQRRKELDKAYKQQQKAYEAEEDALKKTLDSQYDERKKALDAELSALKKANDKRLKELKKANEAETKAFKAETDRRVKALQEEYKAKLKLLEAESGVDEIDSRIKELKAETKAEKAELKKREQQEKVSELQKAVEQAKTRRKKADAEKALNDYLAELAQEAREEEREAEIDRLNDQKDLIKDELAAKKDALKEEYDVKIAALKEQRAAELEVIQENNDLEYEQLKEKLDAEYQQRKDANDATLQALKDSNSEQLEAMRDSHKEALEALKESQSEQLEALKDSQSDQLAAIKEGHQSQLEALKESQQAQLEALKESQQEQLQALKESQQDQLQAMKDAASDQIDVMKDAAKGLTAVAADTGKKITETEKSTTKNVTAEQRARNTTQAKLAEENKNKLHSTTSATMQVLQQEIVNAKAPLSSKSKDIYEAVKNNVDPLARDVPRTGQEAMNGLNQTMERGKTTAGNNARNIADSIESPLSSTAARASVWGDDMMLNFNNSTVSRWNNTMLPNLQSMADSIRDFFGHSKPKRGPLKDDDVWFLHMVQNFERGAERGAPSLMATVEDIAQDVADAFDGQAAPSIVDGLVRDMESKESALARETRRIAEIVGDEFEAVTNKTVSFDVDAKPVTRAITMQVNEALRGGIHAGGVTVVMNGVTVREEADIDRISERLYQKVESARRRGL